jgi:PKD repeat protein
MYCSFTMEWRAQRRWGKAIARDANAGWFLSARKAMPEDYCSGLAVSDSATAVAMISEQGGHRRTRTWPRGQTNGRGLLAGPGVLAAWLLLVWVCLLPGASLWPGLAAEPVNELVILIDTSGSMTTNARIAKVRTEVVDVVNTLPLDGTWRVRLHSFDRGLSKNMLVRQLQSDADLKATKLALNSVEAKGRSTWLFEALDQVLAFVEGDVRTMSGVVRIHLFTDGENNGGRGQWTENLDRFQRLQAGRSGRTELCYHALEFAVPESISVPARRVKGITILPDFSVPPVVTLRRIAESLAAETDIQFIAMKVGTVERWLWRFGDGGSSNKEFPTYRYAKPGTYQVQVTAANSAGASTDTMSITVRAQPPKALIEWRPVQVETSSAASAPRDTVIPIQFTDASTGPVESREWDFGDGTTHSSEQNPVHRYAKPGTYQVRLQVTGAGGAASATAEVRVLPPGQVDFRWTPEVPQVDSAVQFINDSTGAFTAWRWDFGDGQASTEQNPTHVYRKVGRFTVMVSGQNMQRQWVPASKTIQIQGESFPPPKAELIVSPANIYVGEVVACLGRTSGPATSVRLDFGDGSAVATPQTNHVYLKPGDYRVVLDVAGPGGTNRATGQVTVRAVQIVITNFPTRIFQGDTVKFSARSSAPLTDLAWEIEGIRPTAEEPEHVFKAVGDLPVTLTCRVGTQGAPASASASLLKVSQVFRVLPSQPPTIRFAMIVGKQCIRGGGIFVHPVPLSLQMTNLSTGSIKSNLWHFGDGTASALRHPTHTYSRVGRFTIHVTLWSQKDEMVAPSATEHFIYVVVTPPPPPSWPRWASTLLLFVAGYGTLRWGPLHLRRMLYEDDRGEQGMFRSWRRDLRLRFRNGQLLSPAEEAPTTEFELRARRGLWLQLVYDLVVLLGQAEVQDANGNPIGSSGLDTRFRVVADGGRGMIDVQTSGGRRSGLPRLGLLALVILVFLASTWQFFNTQWFLR